MIGISLSGCSKTNAIECTWKEAATRTPKHAAHAGSENNGRGSDVGSWE